MYGSVSLCVNIYISKERHVRGHTVIFVTKLRSVSCVYHPFVVRANIRLLSDLLLEKIIKVVHVVRKDTCSIFYEKRRLTSYSLLKKINSVLLLIKEGTYRYAQLCTSCLLQIR